MADSIDWPDSSDASTVCESCVIERVANISGNTP